MFVEQIATYTTNKLLNCEKQEESDSNLKNM